jgi:hypothetical protein
VRKFPLPPDADACASLASSAGAKTAVRTTVAYEPFLILSLTGQSGFQKMSNPLRQSAGLPTVLRNARLSRDGKRLIASSDNSGLAIFDLAARRLIGAITLDEVRNVAMSADGHVALVESGGRIVLVDLDPASWRRKAGRLVSDN